MKKLHLCCGDVYLKDYLNLDIMGTLVDSDNPNETTLDKYYKYPFDDTKSQRPILVDKHFDICFPWSFDDNSVDEIVMICAIEHFTLPEVKHIFSEAYRVLKDGGKFKFDFPDIPNIYYHHSNSPELFSRLLYGTHKNQFSSHKCGFTMEGIEEYLGDKWNSIFENEIVKHAYPSQGVVAIK